MVLLRSLQAGPGPVTPSTLTESRNYAVSLQHEIIEEEKTKHLATTSHYGDV